MKEAWDTSHILEKLTDINQVDEFYKAVDSDNIEEVTRILENAGVNNTTINQVVAMILDGEN